MAELQEGFAVEEGIFLRHHYSCDDVILDQAPHGLTISGNLQCIVLLLQTRHVGMALNNTNLYIFWDSYPYNMTARPPVQCCTQHLRTQDEK